MLYAMRGPIEGIAANEPYTIGRIAPPAIAMINNALAVLVCRPSPSIASGQMAGQTSALEMPSTAMHRTDV